ncbi:allophanate hydrolase [Pseudoduganella lurida]|uniref:Allophanate hydrolase n=1 Tax=Pseudoduganella lurida TaxID=1036180 RepID=A0A562R3K1_9BURK|nr:allophanate hydrolase [Pseudoduganella lurida]TWI63649.1 allophanate hydrolase [Pseudoduganella lurida]
MTTTMDFTNIATLQAHYRDGTLTPADLVRQLDARIAAANRPEIWISRMGDDAMDRQLAMLDAAWQQHGPAIFDTLPLFGIPFAVKDNIDVAGIPTTAACPAFAYVPDEDAHAVRKLLDAGALLLGKTNLDQFATGLVGTRSPHGAVRNALNPEYVSGGSSAGSAVAVALGMASFTLGTDTAGSGRVPAGFNGIVGLKPTRGLVSTRGVVPACRSLDCVSIFARSVDDAWQVLRCIAGHDPQDPFSRQVAMGGAQPEGKRGYRIAVPDRLEFFGDGAAEAAFDAALLAWATMPGAQIVRIPFQPFADAARLLYAGPWVAERRAAIGELFERDPEALDPTVRGIVAQADGYSAVDAFEGQYRLAALRRQAEASLRDIDFLLVPTAPTMPTIAEVQAEPVLRNSELGYYTNFVNFFDMAALAIPAGYRPDGLPAGVTIVGRAGSDHLLALAGAAFNAPFADARAAAASLAANPLPFSEPTVMLAVVGAHLEGQPLNWQLLERGARKLRSTRTSPDYRLYALAGTTPPKPGLARVDRDGAAIEVETWELPLRLFGSFVAAIPAPLGIGSVRLEDGSTVKGFICEGAALAGARDITHFGGWRAYLRDGQST